MSRHITDHNDGTAGDRTEPYTRIEREQQPSAATEALQRRQPETPAEETRTAKYARIDRGEST